MSSQSSLRAQIAAGKRREREAQKRARELGRLAKEQAKVSAAEQARFEVETFENSLEVLLSVHKESSDTRDWRAYATALSPPEPARYLRHEFRARAQSTAWLQSEEGKKAVEGAQQQDSLEYDTARNDHSAAVAEHERTRQLACRILAGDERAYTECLVDFGSFDEISALGSYVHFTVHSPKVVEIRLKVNGTQVIPTEVKTLSSSGKLSVKQMPKARFHEIYQDYVCSCVLRVARETFALLPIRYLIVTASVEALNSATGHMTEKPVLSVAFSRETLTSLDFDRLDPSDAVESFLHRGDFKKSRKSGEFEDIAPLDASVFQEQDRNYLPLQELLRLTEMARSLVREEMQRLKRC